MGIEVLSALEFRSGFTHMEWYRKADGEVVFGEIGGRPPGARVVDLMNYATDGDLYVLQLSTNGLASPLGPGPGRLIRIDSDSGARTTLLDNPLFFPGGLLVTPDGTIYVSNLGTSAGGGQVLLVPEPAAAALAAAALALSFLRRPRRQSLSPRT